MSEHMHLGMEEDPKMSGVFGGVLFCLCFFLNSSLVFGQLFLGNLTSAGQGLIMCII